MPLETRLDGARAGTMTTPAHRDDDALALLASGDTRGAATQVISVHGPAVLDFIRALLRDDDLAADAFSLFAEWTWRAISRFRGEGALRTWAFSIGYHAARRVRDEAWRRRRKTWLSGDASKLAAKITTASVRERRDELLAELRAQLKPEEQGLLHLRLNGELSWDEIALVLEVTPATARKRFERIKRHLSEAARNRGLIG